MALAIGTGLAVLLLVCAVLLYLVWPGKTDVRHAGALAALQNRNVAHRGLHTPDKRVPENSLAAFSAAAEEGYGIELDLQLSADGAVVVFHDDDLQRVCGVDARVDGKTLAELKRLRLCGTEETIPLFTEMLAAVAGRVPLVVELKKGGRNRALCEKTWEILQGYKGVYCIESFDPRIVRWWKKNQPGVLRGQLAAPPRHLNSGLAGFAVGTLLTNCLARPHFIAYQIGNKPCTAAFAGRRALRVAWTARPEDNLKAVEAENDAVIFEFYRPPVHY